MSVEDPSNVNHLHETHIHASQCGDSDPLKDDNQVAETAIQEKLETERELIARLRTLSEIERELSRIESFEDFCRQAVEWGRARLGFERMGLWFLSEDRQLFQGTFGTDTEGRTREEWASQFPADEQMYSILEYESPLVVYEHTVFQDPGEQPHAPCCMLHAPLWDGEKVIGFLSVDNLLTRQPIPEHQRELLPIYATTVAALCMRRRIEAALQKREREFQTLIEHSPDVITRYDRDQRFVYINPRATAITGWPLENFLGKTDREMNYLPDEVLEHWEAALQSVFDTANPTRFEHNYETLLIPEVGPDGTVQTVLAFSRDVRERKQMEQELRESEQRLRVAMRAGGMGIVDRDLFTNTVRWSEELMELVGVTPEQFDGTLETVISFLHPEDRTAIPDTEILKNSGENYTLEYRIVRTDGNIRWVQTHGHVMKDSEGAPVRVIAIVQDITERKLLQEQYLHAQKMESVGRLAGGVAHDFNNLLTAIIGFVELAETTPLDDPAHQVYLKHIKSASHRAADLVKQLLAFARKQIIMPQIIALDRLVTDLSAVLDRLVGDDITLRIRAASDLWPVYADPGQMEQVLVNLVVNARDAMPQGGKLTIETHNVTLTESPSLPDTPSPGEYVLIAVQDTGIGMSAEVQQRVFEPFFTTKEVGKGTGLGLATSYGIVRQNKGFIQILSELGRGTVITVLLPRATETLSPRQE